VCGHVVEAWALVGGGRSGCDGLIPVHGLLQSFKLAGLDTAACCSA